MDTSNAAESFTLLAISLSMAITRVWYRIYQVGLGGLQLDDYLTPLSGAIFATVTTLAHLVGSSYDGLTNSYMSEAERMAVVPGSEEEYKRQMGSKIQIIGWSLYALDLWVLKLCITVFYSRLTTRLFHLNWRVKAGYAMLAVSYLTVMLCILLGCQPFSHNWQIYPDPGPYCQPTNSPLNVFIVWIPNVVTDLYLLSIPLPLLWKVNISLRRKLTLMLLFSGGVFVIAAGTIRAIIIIKAGASGALVGSQWACREVFVASFVTHLPIIQPLLRATASKIGLSGLFSRSGGNSSGGPSYPLGSKNNSRAHKLSRLTGNKTQAPTQHGVTTIAWGSDEHILDDKQKDGVGEKSITVAQEISIVSEQKSTGSGSASSDGKGDWAV